MCTARPESPSWPRDCLLLAWARQTRGHRVRELASSPLAQVAPLGGVGADTGLMGSTRQTGAYQTACDHNQQWQRTMNAIIYKNTVQVSFSLSLLRLFTPTLLLRGSMEGLWPCRHSRQQDVFIVPRATLLFMLYHHQAWSVSSCSLFLPTAHFDERSREIIKLSWAVFFPSFVEDKKCMKLQENELFFSLCTAFSLRKIRQRFKQ